MKFFLFSFSLLFASTLLAQQAPQRETDLPQSGPGWVQVPSGVQPAIIGLCWAGERTAFAQPSAFEGVGLLKSSDSGKTWIELLNGPLGRCYFWDERHGIITRASNVFLTYDGGESWDTLSAFIADNNSKLGKSVFPSPDTGFSVASNFVSRSTDSGRTWRATELGAEFSDLAFADSKHGFAVGIEQYFRLDSPRAGSFMRTSDGGEHWEILYTRLPYSFTSIIALSKDSLLIASSGGDVFRSTDAGTTWQGGFIGSGISAMSFPTGGNGYAAGFNGTILNTKDRGQTWIRQETPTAARLYSINFLNNTRGLSSGASGTILRTTNGGKLWVQTYPPSTPFSVRISEATGKTTFRYSLTKPSSVTLRIYSIDGREVSTPLVEVSQGIGTFEATVPTIRWARGTYVYRLSTESESASGTFSVID